MAFKRYITLIDDDNQTKTIATDTTGLIFNIVVQNNHNPVDATQPELDFYFITSDGTEIHFLKKKLEANEYFQIKPEIALSAETLKVYSTLKDVTIITQILDN